MDINDVPLYPFDADDLNKYSLKTNDLFFRRAVEMIEIGFNNDMDNVTLFKLVNNGDELYLNLHDDMWVSTLIDAIQHFEYLEDYEMCSRTKDILDIIKL